MKNLSINILSALLSIFLVYVFIDNFWSFGAGYKIGTKEMVVDCYLFIFWFVYYIWVLGDGSKLCKTKIDFVMIMIPLFYSFKKVLNKFDKFFSNLD